MSQSKDKRVRSCSWFFRADTRSVEGSPRDVVLGLFQNRELYRSISLPGLHTVTFSVPITSDGNLVCGFIRSDSVVAESAVVDWLPGPDSSVDIEFVWTPIHGRLWKSDLIKTFISNIESNLTTRFDFIEPATKKPVGRPHGPRLAGISGSASSSIGSEQSSSRSEQSIQSSPPIGSSLPAASSSATLLPPPPRPHSESELDWEACSNAPNAASSIQGSNSSIQGITSDTSLGSAASAGELALHAALLAERKEREKLAAEAEKAKHELEKEREERRKEKEKLIADAEQFMKESEEQRQMNEKKIHKLSNTVRRLSRKKTLGGMTLTHSDGTTTKLHNVSNVHRL